MERTILTLWNRKIQTSAFNFSEFKFDKYNCRRRHLKSIVVLKCLMSWKISRIFEKISTKCVKLHNLQQKKIWQNEKWLIFQGFQKLIDFKTLNKSNQSIAEKYLRRALGKMYAKNKNMKNVKTLIFGCAWASYALNLASWMEVVNKSSWMKVVQGCYLPFFNLKSKTDIFLFI